MYTEFGANPCAAKLLRIAIRNLTLSQGLPLVNIGSEADKVFEEPNRCAVIKFSGKDAETQREPIFVCVHTGSWIYNTLIFVNKMR